MSDSLFVLLYIAGFALIFPLFWMAVLQIISRLGGWAGLARQYGANAPIAGDHFSMATARLGLFTSYSNCLSLTVSSQGFHLQPFILLRPGHAPLFLPWEAILESKRGSFGLFSSIQLSIRGVDGGRPTILTLYGRALIDSLLRHAPQRLNTE